MRRGFGRRRRQSDDGRKTPIDASWIDRVAETGLVSAGALARVEYEDVPASFALTASGADATDAIWAVGISPASGGDALLAALVTAARTEGVSRVLAVCAGSAPGSSERLRLVGGLGAPPLIRVLSGDFGPEVGGERSQVSVQPLERLSAQLASPAPRALFQRGLAALTGLAAKHGGAVRATGATAEIVVLSRRMAVLRADGDSVILESLLPRRQADRLSEDSLAECMDRLEGALRKRLNERKVRDGEEGMRARALPALEAAAGLRYARRWPLGGSDPDVLDVAGVAADGSPVVAAVREEMSLAALGAILDAALRLEPWLPGLLAGADAPVRMSAPRLVLAARNTHPAVDAVAGYLTWELASYAVEERTGRIVLSPREGASPAAPLARSAASVAPPARGTASDSGGGSRERGGPTEAREGGSDAADSRPRRSRRSRGRGRRPAAAASSSSEPETGGAPPSDAVEAPRFDEVSLFDLDDEAQGSGEESRDGGRRPRGRRRGRGRGRNGVGQGSSETSAEEAPDRADVPAEGDADQRRRGQRQRDPSAEAEALEDDGLPRLSPDAPEFEDQPVPQYDDEEEIDEPESEADRLRLEREKRRLARLASSDSAGKEPEGESQEAQSLPHGRAAILAHADRESIMAAVVLAREWRQVEGIWIYPQEELMTFFRSVAIDLRENCPIFVVGFSAHPARDVIQAASLYRDRLAWFDYHEWPPEDRGAMAEAIGSDHLHVESAAGSVLPAVVSFCARRSRFSDKLVDLVTARFTVHDFERWGRLWWWRLGELAGKTGERRADVESLLSGRPSDLASEAARVDLPPLPEELRFASSQDFRLVHFGGMALVVVEVPEGIDLHLATRIVRERYGAALSLARRAGEDVCVLGTDDAASRKSLDVSAAVTHLSEKFEWVEAQSDADHVARFRVRDLAERPERLDEVLAEIGMGRSILGG